MPLKKSGQFTLKICINSTYFISWLSCWNHCSVQVRLPLLPVEFLTGTVAKEEMIKGNLDCRDLMDEARNYHLHLSNKVVPDFEYSVRTVPRRHTAGTAVMATVSNFCCSKKTQLLTRNMHVFLHAKSCLLKFDELNVFLSLKFDFAYKIWKVWLVIAFKSHYLGDFWRQFVGLNFI